MDSNHISNNTDSQEPVSPQKSPFGSIGDILSVIWGLRWWILISVAVCLAAGFFKIKATRTIYTANNTILLVNRDNMGSAETALLKDITGITKTTKSENEMSILRSRTLMKRVVEQPGLNYQYEKYRPVKSILFDLNASPFVVIYDGVENYPNPAAANITFVPIDSAHFQITKLTVSQGDYPYENREYLFGEEIRLWEHTFSIKLTGVYPVVCGDTYTVSMRNSLAMAKSLMSKLSVSSITTKGYQQPDVIQLRYNDVLPKRCEAILDALIYQYNEDARSFRNRSTSNTISFLDERLQAISEELGQIEGQYQNYRRSNTVVNVSTQSNISLSTDQRYEAELNDINLQIELLGIIREYIEHMSGNRSVIPANIGIADGGLNATINQYNSLVMERNRLAASSSESNPLVVSANAQINELLSSIRASVKNLEKSYSLQKANAERKLQEGKRRISNIPEQELALSTFERQHKIKEPLYVLLQQKKEEALMALYSIPDQCKIVDPALSTAHPTAPNRKTILMLAFLIGFIIPPGFFYLKQAFRVTVDGKVDIVNRTSIPVMATIPLADKPDQLIRPNGRDPYEEAIRVLRSNFRYYPHRVYQVLSSTPGEGKSFIAANIAASLAHAGKRVLLVGIDLRKPRLAQIFGLTEHTSGVVSYLIHRTDDVQSLIHHDINGVRHLDTIFAGSVPPNPSELIESERMKSFFEEVRKLPYDYILIDSSPYLPVADSVVINTHVDANLFVIRSGVTPLKFVPELDGIVREGKLKNVAIVLNGVDFTSRTYGYANGYGYGHYGYGTSKYRSYAPGYGYKYGYGYGYGLDETQIKQMRAQGKLSKRRTKLKKSEQRNPDQNTEKA